MKNKKGFTLVELLIVIAIIGILASIVLVSLSSARQRAKMAEFKSTASSLNAALVSWCDQAPSGNVPVWPATNNSAAEPLPAIDASDCTGGVIASSAVQVSSNATQTGTVCVATLGQEGVVFAPAATNGGC